MELDIKKTVKVTAKTLRIYMKVADSFSCDRLDQDGDLICRQEEGYVPDFMPDTFGGDYLDLHINLDNGMITNWRKKESSIRRWINSRHKEKSSMRDWIDIMNVMSD